MKFLTYKGTMQETCLRLMGRKMLVALMMEGKFSGEGLQSLDADEDLMSAMARELVERAEVGHIGGRCLGRAQAGTSNARAIDAGGVADGTRGRGRSIVASSIAGAGRSIATCSASC